MHLGQAAGGEGSHRSPYNQPVCSLTCLESSKDGVLSEQFFLKPLILWEDQAIRECKWRGRLKHAKRCRAHGRTLEYTRSRGQSQSLVQGTCGQKA